MRALPQAEFIHYGVLCHLSYHGASLELDLEGVVLLVHFGYPREIRHKRVFLLLYSRNVVV